MALEKLKTRWQQLKLKLQGKEKISIQGKDTKQVPIDPDPGPRLQDKPSPKYSPK